MYYSSIAFPILDHRGEFCKTWNKTWTEVYGACQYFAKPRDMVPDAGIEDEEQRGDDCDDDTVEDAGDAVSRAQSRFESESYYLDTMAGIGTHWGAFKLVGLLQLNKCATVIKGKVGQEVRTM